MKMKTVKKKKYIKLKRQCPQLLMYKIHVSLSKNKYKMYK